MLMPLGCLALMMIWTLRTMNDAHLFHVYTVHELIVIMSLLMFLVVLRLLSALNVLCPIPDADAVPYADAGADSLV
jgi:hypothetical protein